MASISRKRTTFEDIDTMFRIASKFYERALAIESAASAAENRAVAARKTSRGAAGTPSKDAAIEESFVLELFGFVSAIRSLREYIKGAVKGSAGETEVRQTRLEVDVIVLHALLANQALHSAMVDAGSRTFYQGGDKHGRFAFGYAETEMDALSQPRFNAIQTAHEAKTGSRLTILELGDLVLTELGAIHADCSTYGWY